MFFTAIEIEHIITTINKDFLSFCGASIKTGISAKGTKYIP